MFARKNSFFATVAYLSELIPLQRLVVNRKITSLPNDKIENILVVWHKENKILTSHRESYLHISSLQISASCFKICCCLSSSYFFWPRPRKLFQKPLAQLSSKISLVIAEQTFARGGHLRRGLSGARLRGGRGRALRESNHIAQNHSRTSA